MKPFESEKLSREDRIKLSLSAIKTLKIGNPDIFDNNLREKRVKNICAKNADGNHSYRRTKKHQMNDYRYPLLTSGYKKVNSILFGDYEHFITECKFCGRLLFRCKKVN